jgi:hypothetical protein
MIDHREEPHRNDEGDDRRDDRIIQRTHILFSSFSFFLLATSRNAWPADRAISGHQQGH